MPKIAFQKVTLSPLPGFLTIAQPKIKILLWNLVCMLVFHCLYVALQCIFQFLDNWKILDFIGTYFFKNQNFDFLGQNLKTILKNQKKTFCNVLNLTYFGVYNLFHFKIVDSLWLQTFTAFWPKIANHDVSKTSFHKKKSQLFFWNFAGRLKLMLERVLSFMSISAVVFELSRKSGRGGGAGSAPSPPPPPAGCSPDDKLVVLTQAYFTWVFTPYPFLKNNYNNADSYI